MQITLNEFLNEVFSSWNFFIMAILLSGVIFANGFTDAPNAIATCVTTRVVAPRRAIIMSAIFDFLGILVMSTINAKVAKTIFNIVDLGANSEKADRCFEKNMELLYKEEKDALEVIKWTTIFTCFENIFDAYESVIDCIEDIIVKNS